MSVSYGTFGFTVSTAAGQTGFFFVPGLDLTITVPDNSVVYITTDGGVQTQSTSTTGFSIVDVALFVDGNFRPRSAYRRLIANNTSALVTQFENWSFAETVALSAGTHRIQVVAAHSGGAAATVSGGDGSTLQSQLSVTIVKR